MRPDYCPLGNKPCQSLCDEPCARTPQRTWVGLTKEKIKELFPHRADQNWFVDAIKQADKELEKINLYAKEKNT